jgi:hypothetical protein
MTALIAAAVVVLGIAFAVLLGRLLLGGFLQVMFRRVRSLVRRIKERRQAGRAGTSRRRIDRRDDDA